MADRIPGVLGIDQDEKAKGPTRGGFFEAGPNGFDAPLPLSDRNIAKVDDDWHPPAPDTSARITVSGKSLEATDKGIRLIDQIRSALENQQSPVEFGVGLGRWRLGFRGAGGNVKRQST